VQELRLKKASAKSIAKDESTIALNKGGGYRSSLGSGLYLIHQMEIIKQCLQLRRYIINQRKY